MDLGFIVWDIFLPNYCRDVQKRNEIKLEGWCYGFGNDKVCLGLFEND